MKQIVVPDDYDYVGVYLTDRCHLSCPYCITTHHQSKFGKHKTAELSPAEWVTGLDRLVLPLDVPITLQGGEPFLYAGIWEILERVDHKIDILTALPPTVTKKKLLDLRTLVWNRRKAPYPTVRVSYHKGQNDLDELIDRVAELNDILSIGIYYLDGPTFSEEEVSDMKAKALDHGVELRPKEFLGQWEGQRYGMFLFEDAALGKRMESRVFCRNTVVPVSADGLVYRCHSDLYFNRQELALGSIRDPEMVFPTAHLPCDNYGLCSECDVKIKTDRYQQFGYTSANIRFAGGDTPANGVANDLTEIKNAR